MNNPHAGKPIYRAGSFAPTRGTNDPTGYLRREMNKQGLLGGISNFGSTGRSETRSGIAKQMLKNQLNNKLTGNANALTRGNGRHLGILKRTSGTPNPSGDPTGYRPGDGVNPVQREQDASRNAKSSQALRKLHAARRRRKPLTIGKLGQLRVEE